MKQTIFLSFLIFTVFCSQIAASAGDSKKCGNGQLDQGEECEYTLPGRACTK